MQPNTYIGGPAFNLQISETSILLTRDSVTAISLDTAENSINFHSNQLSNVIDPILDQDVATKIYVDTAVSGTYSQTEADNRYYQNTVTLNSITAPSDSVSMNSHKITNLLDPTLDQDAVTKSYLDTAISGTYSQTEADNRYYQQTVTLDAITLPIASVSLNSHKITDLLNPTLNQDASTKYYVDTAISGTYSQTQADSRYYQNTVTLDAITLPIASVSLNSQKITDLLNPTLDQDAVTKSYLDTAISGTYSQTEADNRYYQQTVTLDSITAPTSSVSLNSHKITNLSDPTLDQDAVTKSYLDTAISGTYSQTEADNRYYQQTVTLDAITLPVASVSLNSQKITNLLDPTLDQDAVTKIYLDTAISGTYSQTEADNRYYQQTVTLDSITAPTGSVSLNSHKITDLLDPTLNQDAVTKSYLDTAISGTYSQTEADNRYYQQTVTLDSITLATGSLSLNSQKITNLSDATVDTDALNRQTADSRFYQQTVTLNSITAPSGSLSLNSHKITDLLDPTLNQDAVTKSYLDTAISGTYSQTEADNRYYQQTVTLDSITAPIASVSMNSHKITDLLDPTLNQDAVTKSYLDTAISGTYSQTEADNRYYQQTVTLDAITLPVASVSLNSQKITNLLDPTLDQDAVTKSYLDTQISGTFNQTDADLLYYANTVTLNSITVPSASVSLNSHKITDLADATLNTDALNRQTADSRFYQNTVTLDAITAPVASVSLNSQKITNLANPLSNTDGMNKQYADGHYYLNTVTLNNIIGPNDSVSLNSQKITNLSDATQNTDALNKQTGNSLYYLNTVALQNITIPSASLSLNSQKIINLADGIGNNDAISKQQLDSLSSSVYSKTEADNRYYQQTVTLDSITAPSTNVSLNSYKITELANPTLDTDATNKLYVDTAVSGTYSQTEADNRYYQQTVTLDSITAPTTSVSLNSHKIINLLDPTLDQDAATKKYVVDHFYSNTVTLDTITAPSTDLSLNNYKITNLSNATLNTDALNRQTADSRYYQQNVTLDSITVAAASVSLNSQKLINLADGISNNDAINKGQLDQSIANLLNSAPGVLDTLNELAAALGNDPDFANNLVTTLAGKLSLTGDTMSGILNMGTHKITDLSDATLDTDALNRQTADSRFYANTVTLDSIVTPSGSLSMNSQKIIDLLDPTLNQDAATKYYVDNTVSGSLTQTQADTRYYQNTVTLDSITIPVASVSLNSQKIVNLADATLNTDALNRQTADSRFYQNTVTLDSITLPVASVSLNSQKITNLSNASSDNDALNRISADNRFYQNTVTLDSITAPNDSLSMNTQKIINVLNPTGLQDVMTLSSDMRYQWLVGQISADLTSGFLDTQTLIFDTKIQPVTNNISRFITFNTSTGLFNLLSGHVYKLDITTEFSYKVGTNLTPTLQIIDNSDDSVIKQFVTSRSQALGLKQLTQFSTFIDCSSSALDIYLQLAQTAARIDTLGNNTQIHITTLY